MARMESTRNTYDSRMDSSRTDDSYADYDENDLNATPRGYPRGREVTPRREDSRGQMMPPRDASGRFIPVYPKGQRARSYYKARQSFTPVPPFKEDRHGRLHDALGRWMSKDAAPGEGPEGTPQVGARDHETSHLHNESAPSGRYSRRRSSSQQRNNSSSYAPSSRNYSNYDQSSRRPSRSSRSRRSANYDENQNEMVFKAIINGEERTIRGRLQ